MKLTGKNNPLRFVVAFLVLFLLFYYGNIAFFAITQPGGRYNAWLALHANYIAGLRHLLLTCSKGVLRLFGYTVLTNDQEIMVPGHNILKVVYSCLGLGVTSFFAAFVLAFPKPWKKKLVFLIAGCIGIEALNIIRIILLVLYWSHKQQLVIDHHTIFNVIIYLVLAATLYFWVEGKKPKAGLSTDGKN